MLLAILSDTHDSIPAMDAAIALLQKQGADVFLHCGDVGGEAILDRLAGLKSHFVFGNTDWERDALARYAEQLQITAHGTHADLTLNEKRIFMTHGDDLRAMEQAINGQQFDYVLHGHTHLRRDESRGRTRIINPGALFRAREKTVATLDLPDGQLTFLPVRIGPG